MSSKPLFENALYPSINIVLTSESLFILIESVIKKYAAQNLVAHG